MKQPSKSEIDDKVAQCIEDIISRDHGHRNGGFSAEYR